MLLSKSEQEKLQSYVIKNMIENQQSIRNQIDEVDIELLFIDYMIKKEYKQAFQIICNDFNMFNSLDFITNITDFIFPKVRNNWAEYYIFGQTDTSDDFEMFDKVLDYNCICTKQLPNIIF